MMGSPFFFELEKTDFSEQNFSMLGRAILICTKFEQDCQSLRLMLEHQSQVIQGKRIDDEAIKSICIKIYGMALHRKIASSMYPDGLESILIAAKNSRNTIIHEAAIGADVQFQTGKGRHQFYQAMHPHIDCLLEGWWVVLMIISEANHEFTHPDKESYLETIKEWIFLCEPKCLY
jgi:hypothetical protein